ncbi:MAG: ABC-F family ATP-binding cassette domain-containing protein [Bacillota bacterium]|jgi:ATP-binding cassette subfamily F protein 3
MSLITANNLGLNFLEKEIFHSVNFIIEEKYKIGLVGRNGAGKTSLFRLLTGELKPSEGELYIAKTCRVGIMEQHLKSSGVSMFEELEKVFEPLKRAECELDKINDELSQNPEDVLTLVKRQQQLQDYFLEQGGLTYKSRVKSTLMGLGFKEGEFDMAVEKLSGGQRSKLSLAKLLLSDADILLLDEPTNHLDIGAVEWLEDFLQNYNGTYIVISHDRYFLDKVTNSTFDLENHKLKVYKGSYTEFLEKKEKERETVLRHNENINKEIHRIEGIIEQQKRWNREKNLVTAASKQKSIDRMRQDLIDVDNEPKDIHLHFKTKANAGNEVLICKALSKTFGAKKLFNNVDFNLLKGEKVFLLGDNGCGKSTLFKIIMGEVAPDDGECRLGANVEIGYFDQIQKLFHTDGTVLEELWKAYPHMTETEIRTALAAFLFVDRDLEKSCSVLSGGEKARLGLLKIMLSGANLLLLDEPTNHLDIASREALEKALAEYDGTVFAVSHDRFFINKLADKIVNMDNHIMTEYLGNYDYYSEKKKELFAASAAEAADAAVQKKASANKLDYQARKEHASRLRKLNTQLEKTERKIEEFEKNIAAFEAELCKEDVASDYEKAAEINQKLQEAQKALEHAMDDWTLISVEIEETALD